MRNVGSWILLCAVVVIGCERKSAPSEPLIDVGRVAGELEKRVAGLWDRPTVAKATDAFFTAVAASSAVRDRGAVLAASLQADPKVSAPLAGLMKQLTDDPAIQQAALAMMAKHPGATPDQIGDMFGAHVEEVWNKPPVSKAWSTSFEGLIHRVEHDPDLAKIGSSLFARVQPSYNDAVLAERWNKRIIELAGGSSPSRDKATELFMTNFFGGDRLDKVIAEMLANPTLRAESATALAKLLAIDAVSRDLSTGAADLLADPGVRDAALELFRQLAGDTPAADAVAHAFDTILTAPAMLKTVRALLHDATSDPAVGAIGAAWLEHVTADHDLKADFDKFWFGW